MEVMMTKNMMNDDELNTMLYTINNIRKLNYPEISMEVVNGIIKIEREYIDNRENAYPKVKKLLDLELDKLDVD